MISINIQSENSIPVVIPQGRIDSTTSTELDSAIRPFLEKERYLILDLSNCNYLSSAGIRILLVTEKKLLANGGGLYIAGMVTEIFQVIEMAGLHHVFKLFETVSSAGSEIDLARQKASGTKDWVHHGIMFNFLPLKHENSPSLIWKNEGIVGFNEIQFSIGVGSPAESIEKGLSTEGLFAVVQGCAGYIPNDLDLPSDFRIPGNLSHAGIFVKDAVSLPQNPVGKVSLAEGSSIIMEDLSESLVSLKNQISTDN
jgi:anti-sigma B factor antagonist